jgi:hypothetical protein
MGDGANDEAKCCLCHTGIADLILIAVASGVPNDVTQERCSAMPIMGGRGRFLRNFRSTVVSKKAATEGRCMMEDKKVTKSELIRHRRVKELRELVLAAFYPRHIADTALARPPSPGSHSMMHRPN